MAINFPSTAGQATDGTFTYVVAGITYSWNGESWTAAGSGATASSTGSVGDIRYDADYVYICIATDTWKRAALATW